MQKILGGPFVFHFVSRRQRSRAQDHAWTSAFEPDHIESRYYRPLSVFGRSWPRCPLGLMCVLDAPKAVSEMARILTPDGCASPTFKEASVCPFRSVLAAPPSS